MATNYNKRVVSIKPSSIAMLQGTFAAAVGLVIAILYAMRSSIEIGQETESVLAGLTFGLAAGALAIFVVPLVYFGLGWVVGWVQGFVLNFVIETAGGIELNTSDNK